MSDLVPVVQRLRDRILELEELLGLRERLDLIPLACDVHHRRRTQTVIRLLAARELVSSVAIELAFGVELSPKSTSVYVHFARRSLRSQGIVIRCDRGRGWYLTAHDRAKLRALMRGDANEAAA